MEAYQIEFQSHDTTLRVLKQSFDDRFKAYVICYEEIIDGPDALALNANKARNRIWPRDDVTQIQLVNKPTTTKNYMRKITNLDLSTTNLKQETIVEMVMVMKAILD